MPKLIGTFIFAIAGLIAVGQQARRWQPAPDGFIQWTVKDPKPHTDHIEMSGLQLSAIVRYGVNESGGLTLKKKLVFPMLRTIPNDTHASLMVDFNDSVQLQILADGNPLKELPRQFSLRGKLLIESTTEAELLVKRTIFPSVNKPALLELISVTNKGTRPHNIEVINNSKPVETDAAKGVYGKYFVQMETNATGSIRLKPGDTFSFTVVYSGRKSCEEPYRYSGNYELQKRDELVAELFGNLVLETPNDTLNRAFAFSKIRAAESIYDTKGGLMHGPGGGAYYAAIWANDQAEYANPFFPFLGNLNGNESAINSYRHFARFMNPEFKPIPSSIIAEGVDIWNGAGDRGDMAMIAYGASRFALATGNRETGRELWPLISWCFEFLERKITPEGVIASDNDELEGRFYAGKVNLSTNALAYGGYLSSACLADALGLKDTAVAYREKARALSAAIERYFGAEVQGFKTYKYHKDNDKLRAWICIPLVMGITDRKDETIRALFSDYLWTENGILTESGSKTFWDRSTLYAFRGLLSAGATDACMPYLNFYAATRLLGEHVPYPVEAWPEGNQRHLSAESALLCRTITEGLFGINPTGFNSFTFTPRLPAAWNFMRLKNIRAFNRNFTIEVTRKGKDMAIQILENGKTILNKTWDGTGVVEIVLP